MSELYECPEKSSFCLALDIRDRDGTALTPDKIEWWVGNSKTGEKVVDKQTVSVPAYNSEIIIPEDANICESDRDEGRLVIIRVESGVHVKHSRFEYTVINYKLVPYAS